MKFFKFLKRAISKTILFIVKEIFSFIIKSFLIVVLLIGILGAIVKYSSQNENNNINIEKGSFVVVDLGKKYSEKLEPLPKIFREGDMNFFSLLKKLNSINSDSRIDGILLKLDNISLDRGQIEELGLKLKELKDNNKKVISFALNMNNKNYSLALNSNEIIMPPTMSASVNIIGYYNELTYYKGLADKLGIKFNVIHVGDYKSYGENLTKEEMSPEYRENIKRLQNKVYDNFINKVASERDISKELINKRILAGDFVFSEPYQMKKSKLIDKLFYEEQLKSLIGEKKLISIENYQESISKSSNKIAIIYGEGNILLDGDKGGIGNTITPEKIISEMNKAFKNPQVKGIVLRLNSSGGSALASNLIYNKIKEIGTKKPVYVSIGGVAASGGYYIAASGNKIFADKESITGSIGVVSLIPNFNELMKKLDVNVENVKMGEYSDLFSLTKEFNSDDEKKIYEYSLKIYNEFLDIVAQSRNLNRNYVHSIAQGQVWLGEEGKELGLIDEIGGLETAISSLAKDLNLNNYETINIIENKKFNVIIKQYFSLKTFLSIDSSMELFFKPSYFFPYNM